MFLVRAEIFCAGVRQIIANRAGSAKIIDNRVLHFFIAQSANKKKNTRLPIIRVQMLLSHVHVYVVRACVLS